MDLSQLPENLPIPVDDGGCQHLPGKLLLHLTLHASNSEYFNFKAYLA